MSYKELLKVNLKKKIIKMNKCRLVVIAGPTSSGKTSLAKKLIRKYNGEVISADSRQIYRHMDIGTGKDKSFLQHMIDIREPNEKYSLAEYQQEVYKIIDDIFSRGKIPFLVGGTGLYINAIIYGYQIPKTDLNLRKKIEKYSDKRLISELKKNDPLSLEKNKNNRRRLVRALEVYLLTSRPLSEYKNKKPNFSYLLLGINLSRKKLYKRIDQQVEKRIKDGMIIEVKKLLEMGLNHHKMENFGLEYRAISEYLQNPTNENWKSKIENLKFKTHDFARRQLTWLRKNKEIVWVKNNKDANKAISDFLYEKK